MVCVGWIESQIISDDDREIISSLKKSLYEIENNSNCSETTKLNLNTAINRIYKRLTS